MEADDDCLDFSFPYTVVGILSYTMTMQVMYPNSHTSSLEREIDNMLLHPRNYRWD